MEARGGTSPVQRLIEKAVRAGAFSVAARQYPDARETFLAAADVNSERVRALADEIATTRGGNLGCVRMRR